MADVKFRVSSALKTILGKELITDDFIAVFELVKNAFDAQAKSVTITFDKKTVGKEKVSRIIISDDGIGMDEDDIKNKWLFVAYSAKQSQQDYRDKIKSNRIFAGAKGIGRFSCDRLGGKLNLFTRTKKKGSKWQVLEVNWDSFEVDPEKEFQQIPARHSAKAKIPFKVNHGTVLEILDLRHKEWDREKLLQLRRSLERLVNPHQGNDSSNFKITLKAPSEAQADKKVRERAQKVRKPVEIWNIVNGPIRNFVFEKLGLKTAQINVFVPSDGSTVTTRLEDRGALIYEVVERNPHQAVLKDVNVTLFHLNLSAKFTFSRSMGVSVKDYGSVFLYKNGFRVHPFGDPGDDNLGIDARHQQGHYRTLGTRDLSGRIEINGDNPAFRETSSRDGGLIKNDSFDALKSFVLDFGLKRLEKYVIDLLKFGGEKGELPNQEELSATDAKQAIFDIVSKLTQSKDVIDVRYDPSFLDILENKSSESVSSLLHSLKRIAAERNDAAISAEVRKAEKQLERLSKAKEEAEKAEVREREKANDAEKRARLSAEKAERAEAEAREAAKAAKSARQREKQLSTQNLFLKSALSKDLDHVIALHHTVGQDALTIEQYVTSLMDMLKGGDRGKPEAFRVKLERISFLTKKIRAVTRFATHANFLADSEVMSGDLLEYIREYLENVYLGMILDTRRNVIPITFRQGRKDSFTTTFAPISISIVFDNLLSNAKKHNVKHVDIRVTECSKDRLIITVGDDGHGIPRRHIPHIFDLGFSTTSGSGLGLYHTRGLMEEMGGTISVVENRAKGAEFVLTFPRQT